MRPASADLAEGSACVDQSPLIAPADAPGPYDEMGTLAAAWESAAAAVPG